MQSSKEKQGDRRKHPQWSGQRNTGKQLNGKDWRSLQENQRCQGNISCKYGLNKGWKWYGPKRSRRYIKKRWKEYTEELYRKHYNDPDNQDGVNTHLEPDILGCEVKWALGNITTNKANGGDKIPAELFQILKDDAVKVLHSANLENSAVATGLKKISIHSNPKERKCQSMLKLLHNCTHLTG